MYRPNNPRFNRPPLGNSGPHYGPRPRAPNHFRKDAPNVHSKDASQAQASMPPPALKPYGPEINKWKPTFGAVETKDQDNKTSSDTKGSPDRKRFLLYNPYERVKSDPKDKPTPGQPPVSSKSRGRWDIDASKKQWLSSEPPTFPTQQTDSTADHKDIDYRPEVSTLLRSLPQPVQSYQQSSGYSGPDSVPPPRLDVNKDPKTRNQVDAPKNLINCDLCEVELSNGQELEEHLDSKTHWDTLEYIQKHNNYDDMVIAFLQDVMLYKSRNSSRPIEDTALQALQDYDHMTKMEMFHCAACNAFVPTSAFAVQHHITSQEHMTNTKEFEARQRRLCLDKASTMMKELRPQFMTFVKGASPFERLETSTS